MLAYVQISKYYWLELKDSILMPQNNRVQSVLIFNIL